MTNELTRKALELAIELTKRDRDERLSYLNDMLDRCTLAYNRHPINESIRKMTADYQHRIDTLVALL